MDQRTHELLLVMFHRRTRNSPRGVAPPSISSLSASSSRDRLACRRLPQRYVLVIYWKLEAESKS